MTAAALPNPAPAAFAAGEFAFEPRDFERIRTLIHARAGISLHAGKQALVYSRLSRRLRETGHRSFGSYLDRLESATGNAEAQAFVNALTTNLTSFFREAHHFEALRLELEARRGQRLRIWCAAASTGEEPWSIAMTVVDTLGADAPVQIVASDIDTEVLAAAGRGVYPADARGLVAEQQHRHFLRGTGAQAGLMRIKPTLARRVEFRPHNLLEPGTSLGERFDLVFCRNVMIYFDTATQRRVLAHLHAAMKPGARLYVGHSENFGDQKALFRLRGQTTYERA